MKRLDFLKSLLAIPAAAKVVVNAAPDAAFIEPSPPMPDWDDLLKKSVAGQMKYAAERPRFYNLMTINRIDLAGMDAVDHMKKMIEYARQRGEIICKSNTDRVYLNDCDGPTT